MLVDWRVGLNPQSTYIPRLPKCLSPRQNWDAPHPLSRERVCLPPGTKGVGHTRLRVRGWGVLIRMTGEKA